MFLVIHAVLELVIISKGLNVNKVRREEHIAAKHIMLWQIATYRIVNKSFTKTYNQINVVYK